MSMSITKRALLVIFSSFPLFILSPREGILPTGQKENQPPGAELKPSCGLRMRGPVVLGLWSFVISAPGQHPSYPPSPPPPEGSASMLVKSCFNSSASRVSRSSRSGQEFQLIHVFPQNTVAFSVVINNTTYLWSMAEATSSYSFYPGNIPAQENLFLLVAKGQGAQLFTHAVFHNHLSHHFRGPFQIIFGRRC